MPFGSAQDKPTPRKQIDGSGVKSNEGLTACDRLPTEAALLTTRRTSYELGCPLVF
jgi:hypothetical protein